VRGLVMTLSGVEGIRVIDFTHDQARPMPFLGMTLISCVSRPYGLARRIKNRYLAVRLAGVRMVASFHQKYANWRESSDMNEKTKHKCNRLKPRGKKLAMTTA
jgi:hypothetical protein